MSEQLKNEIQDFLNVLHPGATLGSITPSEETQEIPLNLEGGGVLEENPLDIEVTPGTLFNQLMNPPSLRFTWHGKDISGNSYQGQGATTQDCHDAAALAGAVTCHMDANPLFIEPEAEILPDPESHENNAMYCLGFADGDAAYQDVKTLILAWVSEQMLSSNPGFAQDIESIPFVTYVRYNR